MDVLVDIDGTLADVSHRLVHLERQPKDWQAFFDAMHLDAPIAEMIALSQALAAAGHRVLLITGRPATHRAETEAWLRRHGVVWHELRMRAGRDWRPDDIVKVALVEALRRDGYAPVLAFEDRSRVVNALRRLGIRVAQVAEGAF